MLEGGAAAQVALGRETGSALAQDRRLPVVVVEWVRGEGDLAGLAELAEIGSWKGRGREMVILVIKSRVL